jgi:uncharacterized protein YndB with AHSA1/START domain
MQEQSVTHSTFTIERSYSVPPERAFADPAQKCRWFAEGEGSAVEEFEMDFRVGGKERTSFRIRGGPYDGTLCTNDSIWQDIVPNSRLVVAYTMTLGDRRISASLATFELLSAETGTALIFTEQAAFFEGADGPQMREDGWRQLLSRLAKELA